MSASRSLYHDTLLKDAAEREKFRKGFAVHADGAEAALNAFLRYLRDILDDLAQQGNDEIHGAPILLAMDFADAIDGVTLLVREGAAKCCLPLLRQALEVKLNLSYITQNKTDYERRALAYEFWQGLAQLEWANKLDPVHSTGRTLREELGEHASTFDRAHIPGQRTDIQDHLDTCQRYKIVRDEKKRMEDTAIAKLERKKGTPANSKERKSCRVETWHRLWDGPSNVREIAKVLGELHNYESLYRLWSESVHGAAAGKRVVTASGTVPHVHPLRHPGGLFTAALTALTFCMELGTHLVKFYSPERFLDFANYMAKNVLPRQRLMERYRGLN